MQYKLEEKNLSAYDKLSREQKIIFLAGIFDGEGSFGCFKSTNRNSTKRYLQVAVETTDADMVARFAEVFGGHLYPVKRRKEHHKHIFKWRINGVEGWKVLDQMVPYMCFRRRQKYATLEPHRNSPKNSGRDISE